MVKKHNKSDTVRRLKQKEKKIKKNIQALSAQDRKKIRAIALKYEVGKSKAPKIVATGKGVVAQKILKVAEENKVPFFEDKSLTDLLAKLDLDVEVPPELFTLVAEVLAVVYQMDKMAKKRSKMSKEKKKT